MSERKTDRERLIIWETGLLDIGMRRKGLWAGSRNGLIDTSANTMYQFQY